MSARDQPPAATAVRDQTICDFGEQWTAFRDNTGYYGSAALFEDLFAPLVTPADVAGRRVADVGSGTGRIVTMLLDCGAAHVTAVEPSAAIDVLTANLVGRADRVTALRVRGDELPASGDLDYVFSVGVLHHVPDPAPVVRAARNALHDGGRLAVWLYGREGNGPYLAVTVPLRAVTTRLPHRMLVAICWMIYPLLAVYIAACRMLPLPMKRYMNGHLARLTRRQRILTIYDQLNPAWAMYYTRAEAIELLRTGGFTDIRVKHRHGYSWTVVGTR